jgi:hypothetical protein
MTSDSHRRLMREIPLIFRRTTAIIQYPPLRWEYGVTTGLVRNHFAIWGENGVRYLGTSLAPLY